MLSPLTVINIDNDERRPMWLTREFKPVAHVMPCEFAAGRYRAFIVTHTGGALGIREYSLIPTLARAIELVNDAIADSVEDMQVTAAAA